MIAIYIDDIIILADLKKIQEFKDHLSQVFEIKDLGEIEHCLSIEFLRKHDSIIMRQRGYIHSLIVRFKMTKANIKTPMEPTLKLKESDKCQKGECNVPYRELIGCLMYLVVSARPDIAFVISSLSQFNNKFGQEHWKTAKCILRYL